MKGRIFVTLFGLPFFFVGVFMLWSISSTFFDAYQMRNWQPTQAKILTAGYETHSGDDSNTYEAYARYTYTYMGQTFTGDRVSLGGGGDNIGDYQQDLGRTLSSTMARGETITVYVNDRDPGQSIIDRSIRWGLIGFKSIFLFVFGGVGTFLIVAAWRMPKEKDATLSEFQASPWLMNDKWQTASILSGSKAAMWSTWAFAGIWSLISAPLPFVAYREVVEKDNTIALVALLFPVVGIGLITWATRKTLEWRRFGRTPVALDPFPGSIGGHVGGTIDMRLPYDSSRRFVLTLTSIHSYMSGSGDSRSRKETANWQDELVAHAESSVAGTRLSFRFEVPDGLNESDAEQSSKSYDLWRLNLHAELSGTDLDRDFDIPVYATAASSKNISDRKYGAPDAVQDAVHDKAITDIVRISSDGLGKQLVYPMGRNIVSNGAAILIGGTFAAVGRYLIVEEGAKIFGGIFGGVGALVAISALYMLFKSLHVTLDGDTIHSVRRWLGIPIKHREMRRSEFLRFEKDRNTQTQAGGKHIKHYKIRAIDRHANELILGEGIKGERGVDAAIRFLSRELGLREEHADKSHTLDKSMFDKGGVVGS